MTDWATDTTIIIATLCIAMLAADAVALAITLAHRWKRTDYDGMEFDKPLKQHPIWRNDE